MHYHLARLRRGNGIRFDGPDIAVDLDAVTADDHITDDAMLLAACHTDAYFFVSGGGTLLIDRRYLLVVRREETARINPGALSLFTGRAEGPEEWEQPWRVLRELFEELSLFEGGKMLYPRCAPYQPLIDAVHGQRDAAAELALTPRPLSTGRLSVRRGGQVTCDMQALLSVNARNDINVLFLFEAALDLANITATDNELGRTVGALNIATGELIELSGPPGNRRRTDASALPMATNLTAMLEQVRAL